MLHANSTEEGIDAHVKWTQHQLNANSINDHLQHWSVYTALVLRQRQAYLQYPFDMSQSITLSINITHIIFIIIIRNCKHSAPTKQAHEQVQALADTSTCWHSAFGAMLSWQQTHAPTANLSNSAQLDSTPYHFRKLHIGPCSSAEMWRGTDIQTDTHTDGCDQYTFRLGYASHEM